MRFIIAKLIVTLVVAPLARLAQRIGGGEIWISLIAAKAQPFGELESAMATMELQTEINLIDRKSQELPQA